MRLITTGAGELGLIANDPVGNQLVAPGWQQWARPSGLLASLSSMALQFSDTTPTD